VIVVVFPPVPVITVVVVEQGLAQFMQPLASGKCCPGQGSYTQMICGQLVVVVVVVEQGLIIIGAKDPQGRV